MQAKHFVLANIQTSSTCGSPESTRPMDTPLDFLRNWLPIGHRDGESEGAREVRNWLGEMQGAPAEELLGSLAHRLTGMAAKQRNLHMRVKLIDTFNDIAQELLPPLEREIEAAPLPFSSQIQARALAADNLLKGLAAAYGSVATNIEERKLAGGLIPLLQHALQRAIVSLQRRQLLAYRAYATPSGTSWQQLHDFYRAASRLGLLGPNKSGHEIGHLYISTLLIAYADPGKFPRTDLDVLLDCATRAAALVRVRYHESMREIQPGTPIFVVTHGDTDPGKPLVRVGNAGRTHSLYLDCSELSATIRSDIGAKARLDMPHEWLLPRASLAMLRTLAGMWGAQPTRRYSRMRFKPRADLVIGLLDMSLFLTGAAYRRRRDDSSRRMPTSPAVSEWALIDESPDGFGIRYVKGDIGKIEVGDPVAIRPHDSNQIQICLVRRVSNAGLGRYELGLQNISPQARVIELPEIAGKPRTKAVLLPRMPAYGNAAGLLAMPGTVPPTLEISYPAGMQTVHLRLGLRVDGNANTEFHLLQPLEAAKQP